MYKNINLIVYSNEILEQTNYLREMVDQKDGLLAMKNNNVNLYLLTWKQPDCGRMYNSNETVCVL